MLKKPTCRYCPIHRKAQRLFDFFKSFDMFSERRRPAYEQQIKWEVSLSGSTLNEKIVAVCKSGEITNRPEYKEGIKPSDAALLALKSSWDTAREARELNRQTPYLTLKPLNESTPEREKPIWSLEEPNQNA